MNINKIIRKHALANAIKFQGKANPKAMIGKLISEVPDVKKDMKTIMKLINEIVNEVNELSAEEQYTELNTTFPEMLEEKPKQEKKELKELPNSTQRPVIMRFEPSPSGPMHIGHAYPASLNYLYTKKYNGKMILRISDTNPENIDPEAYELIKNDADWLFGKSEYEFYIQSDRIKNYYKRAEELIEKKAAYICTCENETFRNLLLKKTACPCRANNIEKNKELWQGMLDGNIKQGKAVMRFKSDIKHKNPAIRDFPLMRINETNHPRTGNKYRVWPLMNMSVAVDDMETEISHTLRGKDHADNAKKQAMIHEVFGYKTPYAISVGRINFEGFPVSCSKTKALIEEGKYEGWEDIRIPFLLPLRKRGYLPESIREYAVEIGVTQNDKSVLIEDYFKTLNAINKSILDSKTNRYFFINNPVEIKIENAPVQSVNLDLHPDKKDAERKFVTDQKFYITKKDYKHILLQKDNEIFRLMDCLNFTKQDEKLIFDSTKYEKFKDKGKIIIHWLPAKKYLKCNVVMPDGKIISGYGETNMQNIKQNEIVQLERFGFCKLTEKTKNNMTFWFTHK